MEKDLSRQNLVMLSCSLPYKGEGGSFPSAINHE